MTNFDWIGLKNETGATQVELANIVGTTQGNISKRIKAYRIEDTELEALQKHYGTEVIDRYVDAKIPTDINNEVIMVPVFNLDARGGFASNDELRDEYVTGLMPFSRSIATEGDLVISVYGDSMAPKYPSGCMILIRKVEMWREYLELGATYVLELTDYRRIIKTIKKGSESNSFLLESINPNYEPSEVPKSMINLIFSVVMSIQRETL
jgi:SOS-response transcriptional repressor LexA